MILQPATPKSGEDPGGRTRRAPPSSTNKIDRHDITKLLLKVELISFCIADINIIYIHLIYYECIIQCQGRIQDFKLGGATDLSQVKRYQIKLYRVHLIKGCIRTHNFSCIFLYIWR
jgi:hypothetical protein